jgi:hypothetical protein
MTGTVVVDDTVCIVMGGERELRHVDEIVVQK